MVGVPSHCGEPQPTPSLSAPTWAIALPSLAGPEQLGSWKLLKTRGQKAQILGSLCHHGPVAESRFPKLWFPVDRVGVSLCIPGSLRRAPVWFLCAKNTFN